MNIRIRVGRYLKLVNSITLNRSVQGGTSEKRIRLPTD